MEQETSNTQTSSGAVTQPATPTPEVVHTSSKLLMIVGGALLFFVLVGVGVYLFSSKSASTKMYHVGVLSALAYFDPTIDGFKQKMTELGYVEGKNITYDVQKGPAPVGNQTIIKKFVDDKVDLILVFPTEASLEAKEGTKGTNIPIISTEAGIEGSGLVENIQKPGGNLTGVRFPITEVALKRFEILHELVPKATHFWIPYLKGYPTVEIALAAIRPSAEALHITLVEAPFTTPDEVTAYLKVHADAKNIDAILTIPEPVSIIPPFIDPIYAFADLHHIPVAGVAVLDSASGPIFSLIPDAQTFGILAAPLADKIFKGTPVGSIPIVTPNSVFVINYKAILRLGLTVSESLLSTADKIVH